MRVDAALVVQRSGLGSAKLSAVHARFTVMPGALERVLGSRVHAITLWRTIFVRRPLVDAVISGEEPTLVAHELLHVAQWVDNGAANFLWRYLTDYLRLRVLGADHDAAYRGIGFEYAAFTGAAAIVGER